MEINEFMTNLRLNCEFSLSAFHCHLFNIPEGLNHAKSAVLAPILAMVRTSKPDGMASGVRAGRVGLATLPASLTAST